MDTITNEYRKIGTVHFAELLRLASPSLPVGGFSYSQGFESAVELQIITDENSACRWISQTLQTVVAKCDAAIWVLLYRAWRQLKREMISEWNQWFYATRETAEARQETTQMAFSLIQLTEALQWGTSDDRQFLKSLDPPCFPTAHAYAIAARSLPQEPGLVSFLYAWIENQVLAAIKTIPLGQTAGQRMLSALIPQLEPAVATAMQAADSNPPSILTLAPQYAIVAARHESQFSRLFRS